MAFLDTAGVRVSVDSSLPWVQKLIAEGAGQELDPRCARDASVMVRVEDDHRPFDTSGWQRVTRGAWAKDGEVVVENACTAGFDLRLRYTPSYATFTYRWRPSLRDRAASRILRSRF